MMAAPVMTTPLDTTRKLTCRSPVPSDIDIAQSVEPLPITSIAASLGLQPDEIEQYGPVKAKVGGYQEEGGGCLPAGSSSAGAETWSGGWRVQEKQLAGWPQETARHDASLQT